MSIKDTIRKKSVVIALTIWFSLAWSWTFFTDSLNLAGSQKQGLILAIIITAINVAISVLVVLSAIKIVKWVYEKYGVLLATIMALALFALADFLVSWLSTIIWIGPEGRLDNILPLSSPSLVLINTPLGFASRIVGFYGLAAFAWLALFLVLTRKPWKYSLSVIGILCLLSSIGYLSYRSADGSTLKAKVISESLDQRVPAVDASDTDLVIFPEYGLDQITNSNLGDRIVMNKPEDNRRSYFLGSEQVIPTEKVGHLNQLLFGNTKDGYTQRQYKYRLIPGGEDLPYTVRLGLRATNQVSTLDYFSFAKGTLKGKHHLMPFRISDDTLVGSAVCSSIIAPQDYRKFAKEGVTAFTNSASLTIFKGSSVFSYQQKSLARFMAVANARYFLQSANSARAYALDINGNTIAEATGHKVLDVKVQNNNRKTIYTLLGEWLVAIGIALAGWLLYKNTRPTAKRKNKVKKTKSRKTK